MDWYLSRSTSSVWQVESKSQSAKGPYIYGYMQSNMLNIKPGNVLL